MSPYQYANNSPSLRNDPSGLKSPAPAGVSQMGWDRMQKIADWQSGNFSLDDWSDSFGGYDYYAGAVAPFANFWNNLWSDAFNRMEKFGTDGVEYGRNSYGELGVWIQYGLDGEAGVGAYFHKVDEQMQNGPDEDKWNNDMFDKWPSFWKTAMGKDIIKTFPIFGPPQNRVVLGDMTKDVFLEGLFDGAC